MGAAGTLRYADGKYSVPEEIHGAMNAHGLLGGTLAAVVSHDRGTIVECFRTGKGIPWGDRDPRQPACTCTFFRPLYEGYLVESIPDDLKAKLKGGGSIADVGCGHGLSAKLIAEAFPEATVRGYDYHDKSIEAAKAKHGDVPNLAFHIASAADFGEVAAFFDAVCFFDCFHDMAVAVEAAKHSKDQLKDGGVVVLIEPMAAEEDDPIQQFALPTATVFAPCSCTCCLPCGLCDNGDGLGTLCPTSTHRDIFVNQAGFKSLTSLKSPMNEHGFRLLLAEKE
mmetsp:Transcript_8179/g.26808  ORF Transcript_8179/g.26808 Transcript_8179/m.26808 type:complete len:281 (+) Transcript_8179:362-1204(+)